VFAALACAAPLVTLAQSDYTLIGAGVRSRPDYDGSDSQRIDVIPVLRYYGRPWFARTTQGILEGGARFSVSPGFDVGAQLAYEPGRRSVNNLPEVDWGASIGLHAELDRKVGPVPLTLLARLRQHTDTDRGAQADLRATAGVYGDARAQAVVFAQATWANAKSNRSFYSAQDGGLLFTSLGVAGSYDLSRQWVLVASIEGRRLHGDAATSAITERKTNYYTSAGIAYRFQ
jgi:outer membrane scaffolding protein for murein synthesis (MipA/OmpV family)